MNISSNLRYPLACSTLTEKECKSITMFPVISAALLSSTKSGVLASSISSPFRDDVPMDDGGVGVLSLYHYQGTARTAVILEHYARHTPTRKQISMAAL